MSLKERKIEDKICCLIPSIDFQKVSLLTAISSEEGANFVEIRVNLDVDLSLLKNLANNKSKLIFTIDPNLIVTEKTDEIIAKIEQIANYHPYAIEINADLQPEKIFELIDFIKKQEVKIHLSKYFKKETKIKTIENVLKELVEFNVDLIKIVTPIKTDFEAMKFFSLYQKYPDIDLVLVPSGDSNKFAQTLTVFLGAKYTYGYISRKSSEALIPINILKRNLEILNETSDNILFQK